MVLTKKKKLRFAVCIENDHINALILSENKKIVKKTVQLKGSVDNEGIESIFPKPQFFSFHCSPGALLLTDDQVYYQTLAVGSGLSYREIHQLIKLDFESLFSFSPQEAYFDFQIMNPVKDFSQTNLLIAAVLKEKIDFIMGLFNRLHRPIALIEPKKHALKRAQLDGMYSMEGAIWQGLYGLLMHPFFIGSRTC